MTDRRESAGEATPESGGDETVADGNRPIQHASADVAPELFE